MSNTSNILKLLEEKPLTSKEIAIKLGLTENDARVYLNRLKKKKRIEVIDKKGRYKIYSILKEVDQDKISLIADLKYDLSNLYNFMKFKMKPSIKFSPEDLSFLEKIKDKIEQKNLVDQVKKPNENKNYSEN